MSVELKTREEKKRRKDWGIFYTDERIVNFIFDVLLLWKEREDEKTHRWHFPSGKPKYPSVIDPACGESGFLKGALSKNFTKPKYVWGIDIDEEVKKKWEEINLLKSFGSKADLDNHFIHQNGLLPLPERKFPCKRNGLKEFDCVVGNPPYGGIGVNPKDPETQNLLNALREYEVFSYRKRTNGKKDEDKLFELTQEKTKFPLPEILKMAPGMPIEVLFIERFIQLAKPGGYIAMIIPDGVLANANLNYVRKFIADNTKIMGIISLPRGAFKHCGTSAKTSILFLKKLKPKDLNYHVLLANVTEPEKGNDLNYLKEALDFIFNYYKEVYPMNPRPNVARDKIVYHKSPYCKGPTTIWVTKGARDFFEAKPGSRWDPHHWEPKFDYLAALLKKWKAKSLEEIEGKNCIISGDHVRPSRGESKGYKLGTGIEYYETKNFLFTGYDYSEIKECSKNAYERLRYTSVKQYDILISCAGVGGVGKARSCIITHKPKPKSCTGDVFIIRVKHVNPFFLYIFLNSQMGKDQIIRNKSGVGTENINSDESLALRIPMPSQLVQSHIESEYKKMSIYHDKAMEAKLKGDGAEYKKNIGIAEKMLKDLIAKTEAVIRGEQKDIV